MPDAEPDQLRRFGRYEIRRTLGAGAFATVYEADLVGIGGFRKPVALKVLKRKRDPQHDATLLEEARLGAWLHHPNVVETYDVGEEEGRMYVAMELVDGLTVRDLIQRLGRIAPGPALTLAEQCCAALHYAHELHIRDQHVEMVHRDVKPANVLVDRSGRVRLVDFGVAWARGFTEDTTIGAGTPGYVSPESIRVERPDRRADLFSLGVLLAEMVAGRRPFPTRPFAAYEAAIRDPSASLRTTGIGAAIDAAAPGLRPIVERCLAPEPADRYTTAAELAAALASVKRATGQPSLTDLVSQALTTNTRRRAPTTSSRGSAAPRTNLPTPGDPFHGRNDTLRALASTIGRKHIVTLTGPGGIGKTRIAIQFGWSVMDSFDGGVWFVDCSDATSRDDLLRSVADAMGVEIPEQEDTGGLHAAITASLESRARVMLVLDNIDRVVPCSDIVAAWATSARDARFLLTTRERTRLADEVIVLLEPLTAEASVALFVDRAKAHDPEFDVPDQDVRDLVEAVDRIPLAIELAAARARGTTTRWLRDQITDRLAIFRTSNPGPQRHATMRATVEWSWELLNEWERSALAQLSVFRGGFTVDAAVAVLDLSPWPDAPMALAVLEALLHKSLLRSTTSDGSSLDGSRVGMFDVVHRFASLCLSRMEPSAGPAGDARVLEDATSLRHARYYARFGDARYLRSLFLEGGIERQRRLSLEHENLTGATRRAVDHDWPRHAVPLCRAVVFAARRGAPSRTAERLIAAVLRLDAIPSKDRATLLVDRAELRGARGRVDGARVDAEEALVEAREADTPLPEARALRLLGNLSRVQGDLKTARRHLEASLRIARKVEDRHLEMQVLSNLGRLNHLLGRVGVARKYYGQALRLSREAGGREFEGLVLGDLALLDQDTGRSTDTSGFEAALAIHLEVGNRNAAAVVQSNLANLFARLGRLAEARRAYTDAIQTHRELGNRRSEAISKVNLGNLLAEDGDEARRLLTQALATFRRVGDRRFEAIALGNLGDSYLSDGRMDQAEVHLADAVRVARSIKQPAVEGAFRGSLAMIEFARGHSEAALRNITAAEGMLRRGREPGELAKLIVRKGMLALEAGRLEHARECLGEARKLADSAGQARESTLGVMRQRLDAQIARAG
ncbi:MAG: serine/threonine protein kinase/tetratricopeptide (TPR) repeat protein [Myxococcota bacterium]